jgi:hypothetical protein
VITATNGTALDDSFVQRHLTVGAPIRQRENRALSWSDQKDRVTCEQRRKGAARLYFM